MADTKSGIKAAVDELTADDVQAFKREEQLSLLPTPSAVEDAGADDETAERAGPGRPAGSRNKRTTEWTDYILSRHRSPLLFLAETYTRPVEDLARELGCKLEEAFKHQITAAKELAPYVHQKQPVALQVDQHNVVQLVVEAPRPGDQAALPAEAGLVVIEGEIVEKQEVSGSDDDEV